MDTARPLSRRPDGIPIYTYDRLPNVPPVSVMRANRDLMDLPAGGHQHAHDFLLLAWVEAGGASLRINHRDWRMEDGDVYIVAPGEVLGTDDPTGWEQTDVWGIYFPPDVLGTPAPGGFLPWRSHPLLFPFVRGVEGGIHRVNVPPGERELWSRRVRLLRDELQRRRDGYHESVMALLTLLLVEVGRLAADAASDLRLRNEPMLADVFGFIEEHYHEPISLRDVASAVYLTPGHLTTIVRRKTGRTVLGWIGERRMAEARRLLVESSLSIEEIGRQVGFNDPGYFVRSFKRAHGATPRDWRRAGRV